MVCGLRRTLVWTWTLQMSVRHNFFLASSRKTNPSLSESWMSKDTGSFVCHITSRLLQLGPGVCAKEVSRHVASGSEHCSAVWSQDPRKQECGLSYLLHNDLHWLTVPQRVQCKLAVTVHQCLRYTDLHGAACQSPKFPTANTSVRPAVANWIFPGLVAERLALWLSQSPFRQFRTHCMIHCVIRPSSNLSALCWTWNGISFPDIGYMSV